MATITHFIATSEEVPGFKFPDQDALASIYKGRWKPLPWIYNGLKTLRTIHRNIWRDEELKNLHYMWVWLVDIRHIRVASANA
jgi:lipopolysaccharide biosynthesis glycosyltransferase